MSNQMVMNFTSPQGSHTVVLQQDVDTKRMIDSSLDGASHPITECSASGDGTSFKGNTRINLPFGFHFDDVVTVAVDVANSAVSMNISGYGTFSGVLAPGQAVALVAFIKACELPDLAS